MSSFDLRSELAARLDQLVPVEHCSPRWDDVLKRASVTRPGRARRVFLTVGVAALVMLLLVGVAAAIYRLLHRPSVHHYPSAGALTITAGGYNAKWPVEIIEVKPTGRTLLLWRCPIATSCGEPEGIAWSPDGHHVAFTLAAFNSRSSYLGLHILDVRTRRDLHPTVTNCTPGSVAWSPNGQTLAYDCAVWSTRSSRIHLIDAVGSHDRVLTLAGVGANAPTWSPDGSRLAFARHDAIYILRLGTHSLSLVTHSGTAPDWSPDGRVIAYRSANGVRLVAPKGEPMRASNGALIVGPIGWPAWSPDGGKLAINGSGLYVVDADGRHLHRLPVGSKLGSVGPRPAWYPTNHRARGTASEDGCTSC